MVADAYLIADPAALTDVPGPDFAATLRAAQIASVLIDDAAVLAAEPAHLAALIEAGQSAGTAVLLNDVAIARAFNADGVHLRFVEDVERASENYRAARAALPNGIVGAAAGSSRHHAMVLGEMGADYIAFDGADAEAQIEAVSWWAEMFEPPVVAWDGGSAENCHRLMQANADFVALRAREAGSLAARAHELRGWLSGEE